MIYKFKCSVWGERKLMIKLEQDEILEIVSLPTEMKEKALASVMNRTFSELKWEDNDIKPTYPFSEGSNISIDFKYEDILSNLLKGEAIHLIANKNT